MLTSKIRLFGCREPKDKILLPEMSCEEEVSSEKCRVLWNVAHGNVEVTTLLNRCLKKNERVNILKCV